MEVASECQESKSSLKIFKGVEQEEVIKKQTQYNNIMQEIITTENNYVNDLRLIDEVLFFKKNFLKLIKIFLIFLT